MALRPVELRRKARLLATGAQRPGRGPALAAVAAWLVTAVFVGHLIWLSTDPPLWHNMVDLEVYRNGGQSILHGGQHLYTWVSRDRLLFTYPPAAAVLAVPVALLPWLGAILAWLPVVYLPLGVVIWLAFAPLRERAGRWAPALFPLILLICAYLVPLRQETRYGQVDILLVALCAADCALQRTRWPRGVLIGLATAIKLVPGVFMIYLLITGRWRAALVSGLTFTAITGLTWAIEPHDSQAYWTRIMFDTSRLGSNRQAANQSLRGMLMRIWSPTLLPAGVWLAVAAVVAVAGFLAARAVRARGHELAGIAITGLLAVLLSPVAWIHHLCWIVVVLGVLVADGRNWRRVTAALAIAAGFTCLLPNLGKALVRSHGAPVILARLLENSFGLTALVMIGVLFWLGRAQEPAVVSARPGPAGEPGEPGELGEIADEPGEPAAKAGQPDSAGAAGRELLAGSREA